MDEKWLKGKHAKHTVHIELFQTELIISTDCAIHAVHQPDQRCRLKEATARVTLEMNVKLYQGPKFLQRVKLQTQTHFHAFIRYQKYPSTKVILIKVYGYGTKME